MGIIHLSIELAFDFIAFLMGGILILQAKDNYLKLYWGIIASCIGLFFIWENIGWLMIVTDTPEYRFTSLLSIDKMLKWYALASVVSLFPMASLYPGYFNHLRLLVFLLPPVIIITTGICYLFFNGHLTPVYSLNEIWSHIQEKRYPASPRAVSGFHFAASCFLYLASCLQTRFQTHQPEHVRIYRVYVSVLKHLYRIYVEYQ